MLKGLLETRLSMVKRYRWGKLLCFPSGLHCKERSHIGTVMMTRIGKITSPRYAYGFVLEPHMARATSIR